MSRTRESALAHLAELRHAQAINPQRARVRWLSLLYGDIADGGGPVDPAAAALWLAECPQQVQGDPWLACAVGDADAVQAAIAQDAAWVHRPGGPLQLPPLVAVAHSALLRLPDFRPRLHACARALLAAGADPDQCVPAAPGHGRLGALYGAAGRHHDAGLTQILLAAGADPDDDESLYHALESRECTRLLLQAGARVAGTNALYRVLDLDDVQTLQLLLAHGADPNEPGPNAAWPHPLLWAIRRRRSPAHVAALLQAGAHAAARTPDGADAATLAWRYGLPEVAALLGAPAVPPTSQPAAERFAAACARGDEVQARALQVRHPDLPAALPPHLLGLLPELAAAGQGKAVRCMVRLGWPIATRGGDWHACALNHAIFRGDAELAGFLLAQGARWTERHGFGSDCRGTLSWASLHAPDGPGDWAGCAQALLAHGMPPAQPDPDGAGAVLLAGERMRFSPEVTRLLLQAGAAGGSRPA